MNPMLLLIASTLVAIVPICAQVPAAPPPPPPQTEGFLDIPWGTSAESVKKQFPSRSRARLNRAESSDEKLQFIGGKFAGLKVTRFYLHFASDRFWKADVVFEAVSKDHQKEFATLRRLLIEKYGPPTSDGKHATNFVVEWYLNGPPGIDKDKINLTTDTNGPGMKLFYASDRIARAPTEAPNAKDVANKSKTLRVAPKAKDDL